MKTQSIDTHPQIEKIQIALLKKQNAAQKFARVCSLSQTTMQLSKRAIARTNQSLDTKQLNLLFIRHQYGEQLAARVKKYMDK